MARNCKTLSPKAAEIFKKLEPFFPPDPWHNPQWFEDGKIRDNWLYDLRLSDDRERMEKWYQLMIGHSVQLSADMYLKEKGSLDDFTPQNFIEQIRHHAKLLLILQDLDFQIETLDIVEGCE